MPEPHRPQVLLVCVHNAGRSQMAAALASAARTTALAPARRWRGGRDGGVAGPGLR